MFEIIDNSYETYEPVKINKVGNFFNDYDLNKTGMWYDFTVKSNCLSFERRLMGRMETGKESITDPAMAF